jgi:hypothetical protein
MFLKCTVQERFGVTISIMLIPVAAQSSAGNPG